MPSEIVIQTHGRHTSAGLPGQPFGHPAGVKASDIVALPLQWGSAIRRRRVFHPVGVIAYGSLERLASPGEGLPIESSDVVGRVSKGIGLPGGLPDIIGLAIKIPPQPFAGTPWDILMASAGSGCGVLSRFARRPVTSWRAHVEPDAAALRRQGTGGCGRR